MSQRIVLASGNAGKLREFNAMMSDLGLEFVRQSEFGVSDADETGLTFVENALIKARHAAQATGMPAMADDSGIVVDALGGAPGLYSARYSGAGDAAICHAFQPIAAIGDRAVRLDDSAVGHLEIYLGGHCLGQRAGGLRTRPNPGQAFLGAGQHLRSSLGRRGGLFGLRLGLGGGFSRRGGGR